MTDRTKNTLSVVIVIGAIGAGFYFFGASSNTTQIKSTPAGELTAETQTITRKNTQQDYTIQATLPVFAGTSEATVTAINNDAETFLQAEIDAFTRQVEESTLFKDARDTLNRAPMPQSSFHSSHEVLFLSSRLASVRFTITTYISGAAHPFSYAVGFNYNVEERRQVTLRDVFKPGSNYTTRLSERAISTLLLARANQQGIEVDRQQEEWIREGAAPQAENFENWAFSNNVLVLYFNPYQVAPYAAGIIEVPIPWQDLQGLIDTDSPVASLLAT